MFQYHWTYSILDEMENTNDHRNSWFHWGSDGACEGSVQRGILNMMWRSAAHLNEIIANVHSCTSVQLILKPYQEFTYSILKPRNELWQLAYVENGILKAHSPLGQTKNRHHMQVRRQLLPHIQRSTIRPLHHMSVFNQEKYTLVGHSNYGCLLQMNPIFCHSNCPQGSFIIQK